MAEDASHQYDILVVNIDLNIYTVVAKVAQILTLTINLTLILSLLTLTQP